MSTQEARINQVITAALNLGLTNFTPLVLRDAGNLILHLSPYPIVARVSTAFPGDDSEDLRAVLAREVKVAQHLQKRGIPVVAPSFSPTPGPHPVGNTWMTLWEYVTPQAPTTIEGEQVVRMVQELALAMSDFEEPLPYLGVWDNLKDHAGKLENRIRRDHRITRLLREHGQVDEYIRQVKYVVPVHGDANPGNILAGPEGWKWIDFEDVSLMPRFWDLASYISNTALFHGWTHPLVETVMSHQNVKENEDEFRFCLKARVIMSTVSNLSLAIDGFGDLEFAQRQLDRISGYLDTLNSRYEI